MRVNQKYFACQDEAGKLSQPLRLRRQYRRQRSAARRSSPATRRCSPRASPTPSSSGSRTCKVPLDEQAKKLDQIVFHEKLGTVADKVERVAKLAEWLVQRAAGQGADLDDGEDRRAPRQGRPRHRDGRRVPRAAGRDRRLLRPRPGPERRGRRRDPRSLQAGRAGRRRADRRRSRSRSTSPTSSIRSSPSSRSARSRPARAIRSRCAARRSASCRS